MLNILLLSLPIILVFRNNKETVEDALSLVKGNNSVM